MVIIKNPEQIEGIKKSCKALALVMKEVAKAVEPGISPKELNDIVEKLIDDSGGIPAFKNYPSHSGAKPFPTALCASVNNQVVHGLATSTTPLKEGDIIGLDNGINLHGYFSDMAFTLPVGTVDPKLTQLMQVTKSSLYNGIKAIKPGGTIFDIAKAIEETILPHNYGIVKDFVGHGVGLSAHEDPNIPNYVSPYMKKELAIKLKPGMVFAIEPMVNLGTDEVAIMPDGWTVVTADGAPSAHFEHSVLITETGFEILTEL